MNLTKFIAVGLCLSAMTASAGFIVSNAFESTDTGAGWTFGDKTWLTPGVVVDNDTVNGRGDYDGGRPLEGAANERVLKLDTEGGTWTNEVNQPYAGEGNPQAIFADMLVKFVPSEELPTITEGKLAIAVKADVNGTNRLNITWDDSNGFGAWTEISAKEINTAAWHRVTVKLYNTGGEDPVPMATVYLDGDQVLDQMINGYSLNSIGFQGTGYIDEVAIRDDDPFGAVQFAGEGDIILDVEAYDAWLAVNGLTRATAQLGQYNAFLMNVAPDGNGSPTLKVSSITVDGNVILTLAADYSDDATPDVNLVPAAFNNGAELSILGKVNLDDATWVDCGDALTFNPVIGTTTNHFFKAKIEVPAP